MLAECSAQNDTFKKHLYLARFSTAAHSLSYKSDVILICARFLMGQKLHLHINITKFFCFSKEKLKPFVLGFELIVAAFWFFLLCCHVPIEYQNNIIKRYLDFIMPPCLWSISPRRSAFLCFCETHTMYSQD